MWSITRIYVKVREFTILRTSAQTLTEYALIIAAIGVIAWAGYNRVGHNISSMASGIDSDLTSA